MADKPIIFSGDMVRAILDGRKTQTRRPVKPRPVDLPAGAYIDPYNHDHTRFTAWTSDNRMCIGQSGNVKNTCHWRPDYLPGDILWVRETFYQSGHSYQTYPEDDEWRGWSGKRKVFYAADGIPPCNGDSVWGPQCDNSERAAQGHRFFVDQGRDYWRKFPSIHMPRWAARLFLRVTAVRAERVQEISTFDAEDEGVDPMTAMLLESSETSCINVFRRLWDSIYAKRGLGWKANPWVWVYDFERTEVPNGL